MIDGLNPHLEIYNTNSVNYFDNSDELNAVYSTTRP